MIKQHTKANTTGFVDDPARHTSSTCGKYTYYVDIPYGLGALRDCLRAVTGFPHGGAAHTPAKRALLGKF